MELIEIIQEVEGEPPARDAVPVVKRLRDSHHAVAKLLVQGLSVAEVSLQTGYAISRISVLQRDPAFRELMEFYRNDAERIAADFTAKAALVSLDFLQELHERVLDRPELLADSTVIEAFKVIADRAGFAPVQRSISKNVNLNFGERLDAARRRKEDAA